MSDYLVYQTRIQIKEFPNLSKLLKEKLPLKKDICNKNYTNIDLKIYDYVSKDDGLYYFTSFDPTAITSLQWLQENLEGKALVEYFLLRQKGKIR